MEELLLKLVGADCVDLILTIFSWWSMSLLQCVLDLVAWMQECPKEDGVQSVIKGEGRIDRP